MGVAARAVAACSPLAEAAPRASVLHSLLSPVSQQVLLLVVTPPQARTVDALSTSFETAHRTSKLLEALGIDDRVVTTESFQPYMVMFGSDPEAIHPFIDQVIGPVIAYDGKHGTDLVATLRAFVRNESSPTKTARALNFHTNTILQRLDRLKMILGDGWRDDESLFRISTAVRLDALRAPRG